MVAAEQCPRRMPEGSGHRDLSGEVLRLFLFCNRMAQLAWQKAAWCWFLFRKGVIRQRLD